MPYLNVTSSMGMESCAFDQMSKAELNRASGVEVAYWNGVDWAYFANSRSRAVAQLAISPVLPIHTSEYSYFLYPRCTGPHFRPPLFPWDR